MSYLALRFDAAGAAALQWSDALLAAGALSVDLADPFAGTADESPLFGEPGMASEAAWTLSRVSALFAAGSDLEAIVARVARDHDLAVPPYETLPVAEEDWVRSTQAQFGAIAIAPGFFVVPSWTEPPDPTALNLRLDPGLAFGTGSHPTTRLCLEWLREGLRGGESVLDYGCGSGILAIAAAKLGASRVVGVDLDAQAIAASRANAARNGVVATFSEPDTFARGSFDVVVANILANPLRLLAPALAARVAPAGRIALSGILEGQAPEVAAAYAPWFTLVASRASEGWVLLTATRTA
ncbi:MAG: 50S ribosomal protein L11 methyltransferase [Burkholderiales bacterium]|nr:50S ribosomal protein L11 methyltransferase [Burkholderiales bacterium]